MIVSGECQQRSVPRSLHHAAPRRASSAHREEEEEEEAANERASGRCRAERMRRPGPVACVAAAAPDAGSWLLPRAGSASGNFNELCSVESVIRPAPRKILNRKACLSRTAHSACAIYLNLASTRRVLLRGKAGFSKAERRSLTTNSKFSQKSTAFNEILWLAVAFRSFVLSQRRFQTSDFIRASSTSFLSSQESCPLRRIARQSDRNQARRTSLPWPL